PETSREFETGSFRGRAAESSRETPVPFARTTLRALSEPASGRLSPAIQQSSGRVLAYCKDAVGLAAARPKLKSPKAQEKATTLAVTGGVLQSGNTLVRDVRRPTPI